MKKERIIAIAGNPNCGKTTLFNGLTGGKQTIGNWPGVTVEKIEGYFTQNKEKIKIVDLPGIYSLSASSEDEKVTRDFILSHEAELVINILDASNIERNLYLTTQLIEMKVPMIIILNRMDIARRYNIEINSKLLSKQLGVSVIEANSTKDVSIKLTKEEILNELENPIIPKINISYPNEIEECISKITPHVENLSKDLKANSRYVSIKLLEKDRDFLKLAGAGNDEIKECLEAETQIAEDLLKETSDIIIADYRYGFIHGIVAQVKHRIINKQKATDTIDKIVLNRFLGIPIFLFTMFSVFWITMNIGGAFIDFFDIMFSTIFVDGFSILLQKIHMPQFVIAILANGVGAGIQTIATFIPIIFFMFLTLAALEDSGYMARAAFIVDRFMRHMGLPGKSFVPMIVGFGCTVPAIMATRTLDNKRDRLMTVFMTPFMSCGARLPVYVIFAAAFFNKNTGLVVFSLYIIGILLAVFTGLILKNTMFKGETSYFVMELPTYNYPRIKHIMIHTWNRLKVFISQAGKVIIAGVIILSFLNSLGTDFTFGNEGKDNSVLSKIGQGITPIFKPLGIEEENWPASVSLFTGIFAKEAVVGTLSSLYSQIEQSNQKESENEFDIINSIKEAFLTIPKNFEGLFTSILDPLGLSIAAQEKSEIAEATGTSDSIFPLIRKYFSKGKWQAYSYLLFVLIYFPCLAATATIFREIGPKLGLVSVSYLTILAWIVSVIFFQITTGHDVFFIFLALFILAAMILAFYLAGRKTESQEEN